MTKCAMIHFVTYDGFNNEDNYFTFMIVPIASLSPAHRDFLACRGDGKAIVSDATGPHAGSYPPGPALDFFGVVTEGAAGGFEAARTYAGWEGVPDVLAGESVVAFFRLFFDAPIVRL